MARKRKPVHAEYRLRVFHVRGAQATKPAVAFVVETTKEFVNFHYEVLLSDKKDGRSVTLEILGIHAPRSVMPGVGPARGIRVYADLAGPVSVLVRSPDGEENMYALSIRQQSVEIVEAPQRPFVLFSNEPVEISER